MTVRINSSSRLGHDLVPMISVEHTRIIGVGIHRIAAMRTVFLLS